MTADRLTATIRQMADEMALQCVEGAEWVETLHRNRRQRRGVIKSDTEMDRIAERQAIRADIRDFLQRQADAKDRMLAKKVV